MCAEWRGAAFGTAELEDMNGTGGAFAAERSGHFAAAECVQATAAGSTDGIGSLGATCVATLAEGVTGAANAEDAGEYHHDTQA